MKRLVLLAVTLSFLLPGTALAKKKKKSNDNNSNKNNQSRDIVVKKGWMQLGGSATLDIDSYDGNTSWWLHVSPTAGYFVKKKFEIIGELNLGLTEGANVWTIMGGARYFFDMDPMWAYAGALAGYGDYAYNVSTNDGQLALQGQGGVLLPLGKNVALDLGGKVYLYPGENYNYLTLGLGYLGVQCFFKP